MEKRALVVGLGIAGMSAAIGLRQAGWTPVIVERAPERRTGGYFIGLFDEGRQGATELGVLDHMHTRTPDDAENWDVSRRGRERTGGGFLDQPGSPDVVLRGDIEEALWQGVDGRVEVRYGTTLEGVTDGEDAATVVLVDTATGERTEERFDLVVGGDGLRSTVRRLVFGPHEQYMKSCDSIICAFQLPAQVPSYQDNNGITLAEARRSLSIFPFEDRPPTALFTFRTKDLDAQFVRTPVETLRDVFAGMEHPAVEHALNALETAPDYLYDSVHTVEMPDWHRGRTVLLGDAAWCLTLYSGMGASTAMLGGARLGQMLRRHPDDLATAFQAWEDDLRPLIDKHRRITHFKHQMIVPSNRPAEAARTAALGIFRRLDARKSRSEPTPA